MFCVRAPSTDIYTLSLHDALPIYLAQVALLLGVGAVADDRGPAQADAQDVGAEQGQSVAAQLQHPGRRPRSEEHTSELQSRVDLVCRLLLEKKKKKQ